MKILFVGNSFAEDTVEHAVNVAISLGIENIKIGTLYVGGCSIEMHYEHFITDSPVYLYHLNEGNGWNSTPNFKISDAVKSDDWDWIVIQHGTNGTSRYTSCECYEKLSPLIDGIKAIALREPKIAFNLTWLGEPTRQHHEIISYGGNMKLMRQKLVEVTKTVILGNRKIDMLIPTGTAIENARTSQIGLLTRDGYHLSLDKGRFIAGLTLISTLVGIDVENISWTPEGVDEYAKSVAIESVRNARKYPLSITQSKL
jgi:hypothetical protein